MGEAERLAACPCCSCSPATLWRPTLSYRWRVTCEQERGGCGLTTAAHETEADAIAAWNTRSLPLPEAGEGAVERVAEALYLHERPTMFSKEVANQPWADITDYGKDVYRAKARAAIAVMQGE